MIESGWSKWEKTPWYLRLFGYKANRRFLTICSVGGCFVLWEYED